MNLWTCHWCSLSVITASENIGDFKSDDSRPAWCEDDTLISGLNSPAKMVGDAYTYKYYGQYNTYEFAHCRAQFLALLAP